MAIKKVSITILIGVLLLIIIFYFYGYIPNKTVVLNKNNDTLVNSNTLTMMYETGPDTGEYQVSSDTSWPQDGYVFNERLSKCENGSTLTWDDENKKVLLQANVSDKCYVYFDIYVPPKITDICVNGVNLENCIKEFNTIAGDGAEGIYLHDGQGNYENANQEAGDNSYRYAGARDTINNFVCFGSDDVTCPSDNLYRIIGVFGNQIKLIKYDYANSDLLGTDGAYASVTFDARSNYPGTHSIINRYYWHTNDDNTWRTSVLNTVNFNTIFLNNFSEKWQNKIANHEWYVSGSVTASATSKEAFDSEINGEIYTTKIGLMYASDFGYATSNSYWTTDLSDYYGGAPNNWMFMGIDEWTISYSFTSGRHEYVLYVTWNGGYIRIGDAFGTPEYAQAVRPCFYLNSDVILSGGTGTQSDPYRIE